jgi:acetyl esterase/lipase
MCRELNCVVVSVDYRLGPSSQYPAANYDAEDVVWAVTDPSKQAYRALRAGIHDHLAEHDRKDIVLDEDRVAFSGFSSGANLALNLVLGVKDDPTVHADWPSPVSDKTQNDIPVLLFYPSLDCRLLPHERPRPRPEGVDADAATAEAPKGFVERWRIEAELMPTYLPVDQRAHPRASPGLADLASPTAGLSESAPEETWGLHPRAKMLLVLPEFDSLHEQSMAWIDKVRDQGRGADLTVEQIKGVPHGWTQFPDAWLHDEAKKLKYETFHKARDFVQGCWGSPSQP